MFSRENDVRRWLCKHRKVWWVENKLGGSAGFPDAVVAGQRGAVFLELKLARPRGPTGWVVEASPAQALALQTMSAAGLTAWLVAGIQGTRQLGALEGGAGMVRLGSSCRSGGRKAYLVPSWNYVWNEAEGWLGELG